MINFQTNQRINFKYFSNYLSSIFISHHSDIWLFGYFCLFVFSKVLKKLGNLIAIFLFYISSVLDELMQILQQSLCLNLRKNEILYQQDEIADGLFILLSGNISLYSSNKLDSKNNNNKEISNADKVNLKNNPSEDSNIGPTMQNSLKPRRTSSFVRSSNSPKNSEFSQILLMLAKERSQLQRLRSVSFSRSCTETFPGFKLSKFIRSKFQKHSALRERTSQRKVGSIRRMKSAPPKLFKGEVENFQNIKALIIKEGERHQLGKLLEKCGI